MKWFQLAARCGLALAQYNLSICYLNGTGIRKNEAEAVKRFQQAANQSFALAQYNLGSCFLSGIGTDKNESEAVHWYQLAAQQRLAIAQNALGICYAEGIGISINVTEAVNWFHLAANQGIAIAQYRLAQFYEAGRGVAYNIQKSLSLLHSAVGQGLADAQVQLGMNCLKSIGGNLSDAIKWFQLAAAQGNSLAQQILIDCVAIGSESALGGMTEEASRLLADAYNKSIEAQYMVGFNYMYGFKGFPQNEELARKWLTSAKNGGHPKASGLLFALPIIMAPAASLLFFQRPRGENAALS